ncbi:hypothetical protein L550_0559 [Bordetella pertussis H973]|nr:hypothetical protein L550_0559 [Bordetella pertussis H973]
MPPIEVVFQPSPTPLNPLGVKGVGECATIPLAVLVAGYRALRQAAGARQILLR